MNNVIMRKVEVAAGYAPLAGESTVMSGQISASPDNGGNVFFKGDDGQDVPWVPGEYHDFRSVDLAEIQIKGTAGDVVTIVGGTW